MIQLLEVVNEKGVAPYALWRESLDNSAKVRVVLAVFRLGSGNLSAAKGVGGIFELRLDFGPGCRVYFGRDGEEIILLLGGGTKKRQQRDIEEAKRLWDGYKAVKRAKAKKGGNMITTRKMSIKRDLEDQRFRVELLAETFNCMASGDLETGKIVLREYINGTVGFVTLGGALGKSPKSLMRMLGPQGNPNARNLFDIIAYLQKAEGGRLRVKFVRDSSVAA